MFLRGKHLFFQLLILRVRRLDIVRQNLVCRGYQDILVDYRMRDDSLTASKKDMIQPQWNVYRNILKFNVFVSFFYLCTWALNGIKKYKKI